jgi:DNA-binding NtrC family response regulator
LRDRREDIAPIATKILEKLNADVAAPHSLAPEVIDHLTGYSWPGNVRELENCLERAVALTTGPMIQLTDLPSQIQDPQPTDVSGAFSTVAKLADVERNMILDALTRFDGDKIKAARALGIGKTTLYRKLKEYGSEVE